MADHSKFDILEFYAVATLSCIITIPSDSSLSTIDRRYQKEGCCLHAKTIIKRVLMEIRRMNKTDLEH